MSIRAFPSIGRSCRRFRALLLLLPFAACGGEPPEPLLVRDSAGISITYARLPAWTPETAWRLASDPSLVLGGLVGQRAYEFRSVADARWTDRNQILVTHCSNPPELRLFSSDGFLERTFGGEGAGRGQCRFILRSWAVGDTLLLYDPTLSRITLFDLTGRLLRTVDLPGAGEDAPIWIDRFADGTLLGRPATPRAVSEGRSRPEFPYCRLDLADLSIDTVTTALGAEFVVTAAGDGSADTTQVLFAPFTSAIVRDSTVYLSDTKAFWIEEWSLDGRLLRRFGRSFESGRVDRGFIRAYREQRIRDASRSRSTVLRELERAVFAETLPAHDPTMIVDEVDHLWVLHLPSAGQPDRTWSVFAPDGRWLGEVSVPARLRPTQIGDDFVLGAWTDADGVLSVRSFPLVKPAPVRTEARAQADE